MNSTSASATQVTEVIVTATKRAENIQDVPAAITALNAQTLAKAGFVPSREIAGQPPGGPQLLCTLDRQRIFGPPTTAGDH